MDLPRFVSPGSFCWNPDCPTYGKVNQHTIRKFGQTRKGTQRYPCQTCQHTFTETKGTIFHGRHDAQATIVECLALLAKRNSLATMHRTTGIKEEPVLAWLQEATSHVEALEALLLANYRLMRTQLDALWAYVGHRGEKGAMPKRMNVVHSGVELQ